MALQSLVTPLAYPSWHLLNSTAATATLATLDAAGEYSAFVFRATEAMTISHVGFRTGTVAGSPTADVRIETVDATTGEPTGTLWAVNTNVVTGTLSSNTWGLHALTASATIAKGDIVSVTIAYDSGTSFITQVYGPVAQAYATLPYSVVSVGGVVTKAIIASSLLIAVGSGATSFYYLRGATAGITVATVSFADSDDDERGLRFQVPFKCRCAGLSNRLSSSVGDFEFHLRSDAGASLASGSHDGDNHAETTTGAAHLHFATPIILSPATWYRATIKPTTVTNTSLLTNTFVSADYRATYPNGANCHYTTFTTAGGWVDTATDIIPLINILIDQLDDGVSSGGGGGGTLIQMRRRR